jgi:pre-mRNA-processing factor 39
VIESVFVGSVSDHETGKKKVRSSESKKRKLLVGDTYDPSSPTSENSCDESPAAKRAAVSNASGGTQVKPVTKARKSLPELEKYWKAVKEDSSDFTGWTYLLQYVDQEVCGQYCVLFIVNIRFMADIVLQ